MSAALPPSSESAPGAQPPGPVAGPKIWSNAEQSRKNASLARKFLASLVYRAPSQKPDAIPPASKVTTICQAMIPANGRAPHHEKAARARKRDHAPAFGYETGMGTLLAAGIGGQPPATPEKRFSITILGIAAAFFVWTTIPAWAEVGDPAWDKEGMEYANKLPPLKIPGNPVLMVGADEQYKDVAPAIAALPPEGGTVHIAKGKYEIGESLRMPSHVALIGEGKGTRIQMKSGILAHVITNADHKKGNTDILIRDLAIVGNLDSQGTPPVGHPTQGNDNCRGPDTPEQIP